MKRCGPTAAAVAVTGALTSIRAIKMASIPPGPACPAAWQKTRSMPRIADTGPYAPVIRDRYPGIPDPKPDGPGVAALLNAAPAPQALGFAFLGFSSHASFPVSQVERIAISSRVRLT